MTTTFRQLTPADAPAFHAVVHAAYAPVRALQLRFDAADADRAQAERHLGVHAVYGLFEAGTLTATATLRYPWGPQPGPFGLPHLGWFAADPHRRGQRCGQRLLDWLERSVLIDQLRAPAYSLGTAAHHPWLVAFYRSLGFAPIHTADLGKGHLTLFMRKPLCQATAPCSGESLC